MAIDVYPGLSVTGGKSSHGVDDTHLVNLNTDDLTGIVESYQARILPSQLAEEQKQKEFCERIDSFASQLKPSTDSRLYSKHEIIEKWRSTSENNGFG